MKLKGLYSALGVTLYCATVATVIFNIEKFFNSKPSFFGPIAFLLLFSTSALVCALIVFREPYILFFIKGKKKEALDTVIYTAGWLFIFLIIALSLAILI